MRRGCCSFLAFGFFSVDAVCQNYALKRKMTQVLKPQVNVD